MSLTAAVISDTHCLLRPEVEYAVRCSDCVIHAGDFADEETYDRIAGLSLIYAVRGNNDWMLRRRLPQSHTFTLEGLNFFMIHNKNDAPFNMPGTDIFIFGHTHRYFNEVRDGILWLNPGSCGHRRWGCSELSYVLLHINGREYSVEKYTIQ